MTLDKLPLGKEKMVFSADLARMGGVDSCNIRRKIAALKELIPDFMSRHTKTVGTGQTARTMLDRAACVLVMCKVGANQDACLLADLLDRLESYGDEDDAMDVIANFYRKSPKVRPDAI